MKKIPKNQNVKIIDCKVLVVGKNTHFQTIVAFYTTYDERSTKFQFELDRNLREILPPYMIPKLLHCQSFPTLVNGKVDRQKLIETYEKNLVFNAKYTDKELIEYGCTTSASCEKARLILNAVCATIGSRKTSNMSLNNYIKQLKKTFLSKINEFVLFNIGVLDASQKPNLSDNFFQIGGTSINAVTTVSKINEHFSLSVETFLAANTIGDLLDAVIDREVDLKPERDVLYNIKVQLKTPSPIFVVNVT